MRLKKADAALLRQLMPYINMNDPIKAGVQLWEDVESRRVDSIVPFSKEDVASALEGTRNTQENIMRGELDQYKHVLEGKGRDKLKALESLFDPGMGVDLFKYDREIQKAFSAGGEGQDSSKAGFENMAKNIAEVLNKIYYIELIKGVSKRMDTLDFGGYEKRSASSVRKAASRIVLKFLSSL